MGTGKKIMKPQDFTDFYEIKKEKIISLIKSCDNLVLISWFNSSLSALICCNTCANLCFKKGEQ